MLGYIFKRRLNLFDGACLSSYMLLIVNGEYIWFVIALIAGAAISGIGEMKTGA